MQTERAPEIFEAIPVRVFDLVLAMVIATDAIRARDMAQDRRRLDLVEEIARIMEAVNVDSDIAFALYLRVEAMCALYGTAFVPGSQPPTHALFVAASQARLIPPKDAPKAHPFNRFDHTDLRRCLALAEAADEPIDLTGPVTRDIH